RSDRGARVHRQAQGGIPEIPGQASLAGDHRVEKPRCEEGLRGRPQAAGSPIAVNQNPNPNLNPEPRTLNPEHQWFAVWTRSRHEQVVRDQLERKRIDAFLPTITRWSRWKDRKKKIDWPLFPGYCFARFNAEDTLPILKCTGVVSIVSFEGKPAPIP